MSQFILPSRATDANNKPLSGAKLYFYLESTLTPTTVYTTDERITPHATPVVADSGGLFPAIYFNPSTSLRAILKTSAGSTINDYNPYDVDSMSGLTTTASLAANTGAGLVGTTGGITVQAALNKLGTESLGTLAAGGTVAVSLNKTFSGNAGGTSDYRALLINTTFTGTNSAVQTHPIHLQAEAQHTAGTLSFLRAGEGYARLGLSGSTTGNVTSARVWEGHIANESAAGTITGGIVFYANDADLADGAGTVGSMVGFQSGNQGHATRVTTMSVGFNCANMTAGAPVTAAFRTDMSSGTGKWAFLGTASAPSSLFGNLRVGDNTVPVEVLEVKGNVKVDAGNGFKVGSDIVVTARKTGCPAAATDLGTAITLVNFLRTAGINHGLWS